jgi:hypothetical protein
MVVKLVRKLAFSRLGFFGAGAAMMYLLDPDRGQSRRTDLAQKTQGLARQQARNVEGQLADSTHLPGESASTASSVLLD